MSIDKYIMNNFARVHNQNILPKSQENVTSPFHDGHLPSYLLIEEFLPNRNFVRVIF